MKEYIPLWNLLRIGDMSNNRKTYAKGMQVALMQFCYDDHRLMFENWKDPDTKKNFNKTSEWSSHEEYLAFFTAPNRPPQRFYSTIVSLIDFVPVGLVSLAPEHLEPDLGIWIFKDYRNKGFGSEAYKLAIHYLFENTDIEYIIAGVYNFNIASIRVLEGAGMKRINQKTREEKSAFGEGSIKHFHYRIDKDDFLVKPH